MDRKTVRRRDLLSWISATSIAGLAGCTGQNTYERRIRQDTSEPPPESTPCGVTKPTTARNSFAAGSSVLQNVTIPLTQFVEGIPIQEIPIELHRRAANLIEAVGGTEIAPEWGAARLADTVYPFHRPDLQEVAYYEFVVEPSGFIILSTGEHDFPVAHWNSVGPPVSGVLERRAEEADAESARFYKLDTLTYAAENEEGEQVATIGPRLIRIIGLNERWFTTEPGINRTLAVPSDATPTDDEVTADTEYTVERSGPEPLPVELEPWPSWQRLKAGYAVTYDVLLESLRQQAEEDWAVYRSLQEFGRGIAAPYTLRLLYPDAQFEVIGEGRDLVRVERMASEERRRSPREPTDPLRPTGPRVTIPRITPEQGVLVLEITPERDVETKVPFAIQIFYPNGQREEVKFFLQPTDTRRGHLKGVINAFSLASQRSEASGIQTEVHKAGREKDQRRYRQFTDEQGCDMDPGAVAWAMLFGWADHQACMGNSYWYPRWGLFRRDAGTHPQPDIDAPREQTNADDDVVQKVIREINRYTGLCNGWTVLWWMREARKYFSGRTGTELDTQFTHVVFIPEKRLKKLAQRTITKQNTPAVIGTGLGNQYPLAWKYKESETTIWAGITRYNKEFYVNHTDERTHGWIPSSTWFCGRICPEESECN